MKTTETDIRDIAGTVPDSHAAELLGISRSAVVWWRQKLGIKPHTAKPAFLKDADLSLSTATVVATYNISPQSVRRARSRRGIVSPGRDIIPAHSFHVRLHLPLFEKLTRLAAASGTTPHEWLRRQIIATPE